jgi:LacI family transcriptional regulator
MMALAGCDHRIYKGVEKYALEHNWDLSTQLTRARVLPWGWKGDGMLTWLGAGDDLLEFAMKAKVPVVDFSSDRNNSNIPRVLEDHAHAAKLVVEHFLFRQFRHFIFYSHADHWVYEQRGQHFFRLLHQAGCACTWLRWHTSVAGKAALYSWKLRRQWLAHQLKPVPKPLVIFAADDQHALELLDACELAGIAVPEEILILGAGDHLLAPDALRIPISSIDTNLVEVGYRGAGLLDAMMNGESPPSAPLLVPAAGLVIRKSSDAMAVNHEGVARCLRLIQDRLHESLVARDFEKTVNISARSLHHAFMKHWGCTPKQALVTARIYRAKQLLLEPANHKLETVAKDCGYRSVTGFRATFSRVLGMTPNNFRKNQWSNKT